MGADPVSQRGESRPLLAIPSSSGCTGALGERGLLLRRRCEKWPWSAIALPGVLARVRLVDLVQLSPEGYTLDEMKRLARAYCDVQQPGDVRAYMDAVELTANRAGALLAGDLDVARRLALEEKAQVSKLKDETKLRDLTTFCMSEDWTELREALGLSVVVK